MNPDVLRGHPLYDIAKLIQVPKMVTSNQEHYYLLTPGFSTDVQFLSVFM